MDIQQRRAGFAKRLNGALERKHLHGHTDASLVKLLARSGMVTSPASMRNWRSATYMPRVQEIEGLAKWLGVDPGELAFGRPRVAEEQGAWVAGAPATSPELHLLGEEERAAVDVLVRLLSERRARPGRKRKG